MMKNSKKDLNNQLRVSAKKQKFTKFKENSMNGIIKVGSSIGNNRFLVAIRDAFMLPFTLTTGAAIPLILSNVFFHKNSVIAGIIKSAKGDPTWTSDGLEWVHNLIGSPLESVFYAIMSGFSIYLALGMGYFLAKSYGKDGIIAAALAVAIFFVMKPLENVNEIAADGTSRAVGTNYLGNNGMLIALVTSMLGTWMYCKLMDVKWLVPKMPDSVPPMVAKAFGAIFVSAIVLMCFAFLNSFWYVLATEVDIRGTVNSVDQTTGNIIESSRQLSTWFVVIEFGLAKPLMGLSGNIGVTIVISFLVAFFWFFGIHGTNILTPVTAVIWDANILKNGMYYVKWKEGHATNPDLFNDYWTNPIQLDSGEVMNGLSPIPMAGLGYIGGTGATLGFLIGLLIFTKSKVHKDIAKLSIVPGLFGINEPVNFGIPIVLNPIYFVPYTFGFVLTYTMGHVWILIHWIRPGVVWTPTMPFGINVLFATDFDWWSILVSIIQLGISFLVWFPFVFIGPKYQEKIEEKARIKQEEEKQLLLAAKEAKLQEQEQEILVNA